MMYPHWEHNMDLILDWLENTPQIHTVFIHNRWIELVNSHRDMRLKQLVADGLLHTCARLRKAGKQIVLLGPVPEWTFGPRKLMRRNALLNANRADRLLGGDFITRQRPYSPCWSTWNPRACAALSRCTAPSIKRAVAGRRRGAPDVL